MTVKPVRHLSYSGLNTYQECPKKYELSYLTGAPKQGAVWFVGGKAVHRATEEWDRAQVRGEAIDMPAVWKQVFNEQFEEDKARDPDFTSWRKAGKKTEAPQGEDLGHWYSVLGPQLVQAYMAWRQRSSWKIWTTPEGEPAIELDASCTLPGMGIELKAYVDRVFEDPVTYKLWNVDLKTGTRLPDSDRQFGIYTAALRHRYGVVVEHGAAFMNRREALASPYQLTKYTPEYVGRQFAQAHAAIQAGYFVPKRGHHCGLCDVAASCYANGGPLAAQYDRDHPDNAVPF